MKTIYTYTKRMTAAAGMLLAAMMLMMTGCKEDTAASLYPLDYVPGAQPIVASTSSSNGAIYFAGVSTITITGSNFSPVAAENLVYFDQTKATVLQASTSQLTVQAPNIVKDSILLRVAVQGAPKFSENRYMKFEAAVTTYGGLTLNEEAVGLATDAAGNLYASMKTGGVGIGVRKYLAGPDTGFVYAQANGVTQWTGLKMGPGGVLYGARVVRALYTIPQGGAPVAWAQVTGASFTDIDFDNLGNLWAVGNNANVYRFKVSDKSVTPFPFTAQLRTVRVYSGYVYVGGKQDSVEGVWRFKLNADGSLGAAEEYFNLSKQPGYGYNGPAINAITFNTDGEMYVGTTSADAILLVAPGGGSYKPFYSGLFTPSTITFAWGKGSTLYASRGGEVTPKPIIKINTLKQGAPYYGAQ